LQQVRFTKDIGEIYKVRLGFDDNDDIEQNWLLNTVRRNTLFFLFASDHSL